MVKIGRRTGVALMCATVCTAISVLGACSPDEPEIVPSPYLPSTAYETYVRSLNQANLAEYISMLRGRQLPREVDKSGKDERMIETIMLGLRTARGISRDLFSQRFGVALESRLDRKQLETLLKSGHLVREKNNLRLSDNGILLADEITRRLLK